MASLIALFGRYNWWLPSPLARLVRVEPSPLAPLETPVAAE
jgi:RND superfamily putative drug exporter